MDFRDRRNKGKGVMVSGDEEIDHGISQELWISSTIRKYGNLMKTEKEEEKINS